MKRELILSIGTLPGGFLLDAFVWSSALGSPLATICLALGLLMSIAGFISFVLFLRKSQGRKNNMT